MRDYLPVLVPSTVFHFLKEKGEITEDDYDSIMIEFRRDGRVQLNQDVMAKFQSLSNDIRDSIRSSGKFK